MEERAPPPPPVDHAAIPTTTATADAGVHDIPSLPSPIQPLKPPPKKSNINYYVVVQVPRDQVYRVPPPENAYLAARYGRPREQRSGNRCCCIFRVSWLLRIIFAVVLAVFVCCPVFYLVVVPKIPDCSIENIVVRRQSMETDYGITMKIKNPSRKLDYRYPTGGRAVLSRKGADVAKGKVPAFDADSGAHKPTEIKISMLGSNVVLPKDMQEGLKNNSTSTTTVALSLDVPVRLKLGAVQSWAMDMAVGCDLRVALSSRGSRLLHQRCNAKLRP